VIEQLAHRFPRLDFNITQLISPTFEFSELRHRTIDLMLALCRAACRQRLGDDLSVEVVCDDGFRGRGNAEPVGAAPQDRTCRIGRRTLAAPATRFVGQRIPGRSVRSKGLRAPKAKVATYSLPLLHGLHGTGKFIGVLGGLTLRLTRPRLGIKALPIDLPVLAMATRDRHAQEPNIEFTGQSLCRTRPRIHGIVMEWTTDKRE
jgi:hypothetical protein